jgi:hypothetical protein
MKAEDVTFWDEVANVSRECAVSIFELSYTLKI